MAGEGSTDAGGLRDEADFSRLDACKGGGTKPGANFEFSSVVTEALLLGNVALRTGQRLVWEPSGQSVTNAPSAAPFIRPVRRAGWAL
jgi:hypothetical protein